MNVTRLWLAALGLGLVPAAASANPGHWIPPFKVNFTFRFDVHSTAHPQPDAPWWAYFPQGAEQMAPASGPVFPHWPAQFPPQAQTMSMPRVPGVAPTPLRPVGYQQNAPSYWYPR